MDFIYSHDFKKVIYAKLLNCDVIERASTDQSEKGTVNFAVKFI